MGDRIPVDFWKEARRRIQAVKKDAVLINEGIGYDNMVIAFDSCYCFEWHELLRQVYCGGEPATKLRESHNKLVEKLPGGSKLLRDMDNHDTVTDWKGRTETIIGNKGMEQIEVVNYLMDGIPMVYCGNELACEAHLNMFANRFYMGEYEVTDRSKKDTEERLRRPEIIKTLNKMKLENDLLEQGTTVWIDTTEPESVMAFKRVLNGKEIIFAGNTKNTRVTVDIKGISENKKCTLCNGEHKQEGTEIVLAPYEYVVFE